MLFLVVFSFLFFIVIFPSFNWFLSSFNLNFSFFFLFLLVVSSCCIFVFFFNCVVYAIAYVQGDKYHGAKATINVWQPYVQNRIEFSLSQIWVVGGGGSSTNTIEAGWTVLLLYNISNVVFILFVSCKYVVIYLILYGLLTSIVKITGRRWYICRQQAKTFHLLDCKWNTIFHLVCLGNQFFSMHTTSAYISLNI